MRVGGSPRDPWGNEALAVEMYVIQAAVWASGTSEERILHGGPPLGRLPGYTLGDSSELSGRSLGSLGGRWGDALQQKDSDAPIEIFWRCKFV